MSKITTRFNEEIETDKIKLDKKDFIILTELAKNSRIHLTKIAKKINLSRDSVSYRIKRMEEKKFLLKCIPTINLNTFGYTTFHVFLLLNEDKNEKKIKLIEDLKKDPHIKEIMEYSDRWDLEIIIVAKNIIELDKLKEKIFNNYSEIILEKSTLETIKVYNSNYFPIRHFDNSFILNKKKIHERITYDEIDLKIIKELSKDCRKSTYEISKVIKISPDTVNNRIKNMIKKKIIENFTIIVNLNMLNFHWFTFAIQISSFNKESEKKFWTLSNYNRNIIRSSKTLGNWDALVYLLSDSNKGFHKTIKKIKREFSKEIKSYDTWIAYKEHYFDPIPEIIIK